MEDLSLKQKRWEMNLQLYLNKKKRMHVHPFCVIRDILCHWRHSSSSIGDTHPPSSGMQPLRCVSLNQTHRGHSSQRCVPFRPSLNSNLYWGHSPPPARVCPLNINFQTQINPINDLIFLFMSLINFCLTIYFSIQGTHVPFASLILRMSPIYNSFQRKKALGRILSLNFLYSTPEDDVAAFN